MSERADRCPRLTGVLACGALLAYAETLEVEEDDEPISHVPSARAPSIRVIAEESDSWEMKLAPSLLGVLMGLLLAVVHVPGSAERTAEGRACKIVATGILLLQSAFIVEFQWHWLYTPSSCKGGIRYRWLSILDCLSMVVLGLYCAYAPFRIYVCFAEPGMGPHLAERWCSDWGAGAVKPHPTSGYVYDALWCVYGFAFTSLLYIAIWAILS